MKQPDQLSSTNALLAKPEGFFSLTTNLPENIAMTVTFSLGWMIAPELWQRMAALRSDNQARKLVLLACACFPAIYTVVIAIGILAVNVISPETFPKEGNVFLLLSEQMPPWLGVIALVALMAAIASTIDTTLNVACMTISKDIIGKFMLTKLDGSQQVLLSRIGTVLIGLPALCVALFYHDIIHILWISADIFSSCLFVPIIGIFYFPAGRGHAKSASLAIVLGLIPVLLNFAADLHLLSLPAFWPKYPYTTLLGVLMSVLGYGLGVLWQQSLALKENIVSLELE